MKPSELIDKESKIKILQIALAERDEKVRKQEEEIERLKELIEKEFKENNGYEMRQTDCGHEIFQTEELKEKEWQQFKTDNQL